MQLAAHIAERAISRVGQVADGVRIARMEAVVAAAEAQSAKETLRTQTASFSAQAEASAERVA